MKLNAESMLTPVTAEMAHVILEAHSITCQERD